MNRILRHVRNPWYWLATGLAAILIRGLFIDLMDVDATQYASISMEMLQNGSWLQVKHMGGDYLDKPPLLFWVSGWSFWLFGISNWAYRLPSVLAALAGAYAVYRFSRLYYNRDTALYAAFILASSTGFILMCNDVRTDTLLMGMTACSVWQLAVFHGTRRWKNLIAGFFFAGLAMLAKGPIGLVMPGLAVATHLLLMRDWRGIFKWEWLLGLLVVAIVLSPMCWGLYQQFDLHPEKEINDRTGVSGLYFYFWEQSFGRITGENYWKNDTTVFFFTHVYLWAFLPWSPSLIIALWNRFRTLAMKKWRIIEGEEGFSLGGFVLTFIALSFSHYKLPHYIFITLPWASILTARWMSSLEGARLKSIFYLQYAVGGIVIIASLLIPWFVFPETEFWIRLTALALSAIWIGDVFINSHPQYVFVLVRRTVFLGMLAGFVLNFNFYPELLRYQSTSYIIRQARKLNIPPEKMVWYFRHGHALDFYNQRIVRKMDTPEQIQSTADSLGVVWVYASDIGKKNMDESGVSYEVVVSGNHFQAALMKLKFLNPATRSETFEPIFLLKVVGRQNQQQ
jgi:4-amino-4-deoxy-L-arabinose transferase-like glycosyltransferase